MWVILHVEWPARAARFRTQPPCSTSRCSPGKRSSPPRAPRRTGLGSALPEAQCLSASALNFESTNPRTDSLLGALHATHGARESRRKWPIPRQWLAREILAGSEERVGAEYEIVDCVRSSYDTFVDVGIWESVAAFERAVGMFMHRRKAGFALKPRERSGLAPASDRSGHCELPPPRSDGDGTKRRAGRAHKSAARTWACR